MGDNVAVPAPFLPGSGWQNRWHNGRVRAPIRALLLSALLTLAGCMSTTVEVDEQTKFPVPLVNKIPLTVGLSLPEELLTFVHSEDHGDDGTFTIEIGEAQPTVFKNLLVGMFDNMVVVDDPAHPGVDVAGTIVPKIAEMQFSTPTQTRTDYFEVWLRYSFELYGHDGGHLGDWDLTAYGKANTQNYGLNNTQPTLRAAALQACRDAMAFFTVQFTQINVVQQWLASELSAEHGLTQQRATKVQAPPAEPNAAQSSAQTKGHGES
jgi:hypothetical protein